MSEIGSRIRAMRKAKGLTQVQLADAVGVDQSSLSDIESKAAKFGAEIKGAAISVRWADGSEEAVFTGLFKHQPSHGAAAALRMSMTLAQIQGEYDASQ